MYPLYVQRAIKMNVHEKQFHKIAIFIQYYITSMEIATESISAWKMKQ